MRQALKVFTSVVLCGTPILYFASHLAPTHMLAPFDAIDVSCENGCPSWQNYFITNTIESLGCSIIGGFVAGLYFYFRRSLPIWLALIAALPFGWWPFFYIYLFGRGFMQGMPAPDYLLFVPEILYVMIVWFTATISIWFISKYMVVRSQP
jgi:hypothetical protein